MAVRGNISIVRLAVLELWIAISIEGWMTKRNNNHDASTPLSDPSPKKPQSLVEFLRESPLMGLELDLERDKSPGRDIDLGFDSEA
jgi:hypothetical protein